MKYLRYKVVELTIVSEEKIEEALNLWTQRGWFFEGMHFVVREGSRRPTMAFITFVREEDLPEEEDSDATQEKE